MTDILERLLAIEHQLLTAVEQDVDSLQDFSLAWSTLIDDFEHAFGKGMIDSPTKALADDIASRVASLVEMFIDIDSSSSSLMSSMLDDVEDIWANTDISGSPPYDDDVSFNSVSLKCIWSISIVLRRSICPGG
jgi:hypothetical protein